MKVMTHHKYGSPSVLQLENIEQPKPKGNEVLIKVKYSSVTAGDIRLRSSDFPKAFWLIGRLMFGLTKPKRGILGHEFSGIIEAVGDHVTKYKVGDHVFGTTTGLKAGSYAEYVCIPESWKSGVMAIKPKGLSFESAAGLPIGSMTASYLLQKGQIENKRRVLIYGASGSVGSFALQLAKLHGAQVTAVCSPKNFDMMKSLGADCTLDYHNDAYKQGHESYDLIFDAVMKINKKQVKDILAPGGEFVSVTSMTKEVTETLIKMGNLVADNKLKVFIDKTFPLEETNQAHTLADSGRKRGNVLIKID